MLERCTPCAYRSLSHACAPSPHLPFLPQASVEVPLPLVVTGTLRGDVLEAVPRVLVANECVGHAHRVSVADGAVEAERYRGKTSQKQTKNISVKHKRINKQ